MRQLTAAVATLPDYERSPANFFPLPAGSVGIENRPLPIIEMHVLARPDQHGQRHAEIVMLPRRAFIDDAALALFGFERHKLRKGAPRFRAVPRISSIMNRLLRMVDAAQAACRQLHKAPRRTITCAPGCSAPK